MRLLSPIGNEVNVRDVDKALVYAKHGWTPVNEMDKVALMGRRAQRAMRRFGVSTRRASRNLTRLGGLAAEDE